MEDANERSSLPDTSRRVRRHLPAINMQRVTSNVAGHVGRRRRPQMTTGEGFSERLQKCHFPVCFVSAGRESGSG